MNEVEKMYENAEPNRNCNLYKHFTECPMKHTQCEDCENFVYPPFTAEKQLKILQLLTQRCDLTISHFTEWEFIHFDGQEPTQVTGTDFVETFAKLINKYWQDLTDTEKAQVKEILENGF